MALRIAATIFLIKEAFVGLVTAPVFKTGEASETMPGGFDSHPLPLFEAAILTLTLPLGGGTVQWLFHHNSLHSSSGESDAVAAGWGFLFRGERASMAKRIGPLRA